MQLLVHLPFDLTQFDSSRTIRTLSVPLNPTAQHTVPSKKVDKFILRALNVKGNKTKDPARGWERRPGRQVQTLRSRQVDVCIRIYSKHRGHEDNRTCGKLRSEFLNKLYLYCIPGCENDMHIMCRTSYSHLHQRDLVESLVASAQISFQEANDERRRTLSSNNRRRSSSVLSRVMRLFPLTSLTPPAL